MATTITILPLLYKHLQGTLADEEAAQLQTLILASPHHRQLLDQVTNDDILMEDLLLHAPASQELLKERMYARIRDGIAASPCGSAEAILVGAAASALLLWRQAAITAGLHNRKIINRRHRLLLPLIWLRPVKVLY